MDTSSIVKRYVEEKGSRVADLVYAKAETATHRIVFSICNFEEAIGVVDAYRSRRLLSASAFRSTLMSFLSESEKMMRLGSLDVRLLQSTF